MGLSDLLECREYPFHILGLNADAAIRDAEFDASFFRQVLDPKVYLASRRKLKSVAD